MTLEQDNTMENYNKDLIDTIATNLPTDILDQIRNLTKKDFDMVLKKSSEKQQRLEDENEFGCTVCQKPFQRHSHFLRHQQIHTLNGERFPCEYCDKRLKE